MDLGTPNFQQDPGIPNRANFQIPVTLQSIPTPQAVTFRINVDPYGSLDVVRTDNGQPLTATFSVAVEDVTPPTVEQIGPITTPRRVPVQSLDVRFSEAIDAATFTVADLTLTRGGQPVTLGPEVTITPVDPAGATFRIAGLQGVTTDPGDYVLTIDPTGILDLAGHPGVASPGQSIAITILPPGDDVTGPTIVAIAPITCPRNQPVQTVEVTFSEPLGPGTFTAADLTLTRGGQAVPLGAGVTITPVDAAGSTFRIAGLEAATTDPGDYVLTVDAAGVEDLSGNPGTGSQTVRFTVEPAPVIGPRLVSLQRFGAHNEPTVLVLTFDLELDPTRAADLANYRILRPGPRPARRRDQ